MKQISVEEDYMQQVNCPICGKKCVKSGKAKAGSQRWLCIGCKTSLTPSIDNEAKEVNPFPEWLCIARQFPVRSLMTSPSAVVCRISCSTSAVARQVSCSTSSVVCRISCSTSAAACQVP